MKKLTVLFTAAICGSAMAEDVWVERHKLDIREGKGAAYGVVVTAGKGDKLTVVERDGKWVKVQFNGKEGYVFEESISAKAVGKPSNVFGDNSAAALSADAAAKGLQPEAEDYRKKHNYSTDAVDKMIAMRKAITGKEFEQFTVEGKVGPAKP